MDKTQRIHAQADSDMSAHGSSKDKKAENTKENKKTQKKCHLREMTFFLRE